MTHELKNNITNQLIDKDKWIEILKHFIEVLRINIFIVGSDGKIILSPLKKRYAEEILENKEIGFDLSVIERPNFIHKFEKHGTYLEYCHQFNLHSFAIPMLAEDEKVIAYMVVGPVALNKRLDSAQCQIISQKFNLDYGNLIDIVNEIRVVSFVTIKSILDLLFEVSKYVIQLNSQDQKLHKMSSNKEVLSPQITEAAHDIYSSICLDELLVTLLDVALNMTKAECGSIMILDKKKNVLTIKVSKGINEKLVHNVHIKIGDGIAGIAVKENAPFIISGTRTDNRIQHLLKRPEIKHALVIPLVTENDVFGVLNLHTTSETNKMTDESLQVVQNLSKLTSAAFNSIQQQFTSNLMNIPENNN